jgi:hypothetical protein
MKTRNDWMAVPAALVMALATSGIAQSQPLQIAPRSQPDPQVLQGVSGGSKTSDCGYISEAPSQVIKVTQAIPYLRLSVQSAGQSTLLIDGPTGRFCVLADTYSKKPPEMSGFWPAGEYSVYIGSRTSEKSPYQLSISQTPSK